MKQFFSLLIVLFGWSPVLWAQLGDFSLDSAKKRSTKRLYQKHTANPDLRGGIGQHFFIGKNYSPEWTVPVTAPVLNFSTDLGGIRIEKEGGGRQTRSLKIKDGIGQEWALRSVRKFPSKAVNPAMRGTINEKLVEAGISASYPYAALSTGILARHAGVPFLPNTLVVIPDDAVLDSMREKYKNSLALLEQRSYWVNGRAKETYNTYEVIAKMQASGDTTVDQAAVLKARLLDNFIMDFDRHADQWLWVSVDSGNKTVFFPVAKDRDQAFFRLKGLLPKVARLLQPSLGQLQGLRAKVQNIKSFNYVAKDFDRTFLHQLDEATWMRAIDSFLATINDNVIDEAFRRQPGEIRDLPHTEEIKKILKQKRRYFRSDMLAYYRFLSRVVAIPGTNAKELFQVTGNPDGTTRVEVRSMDGTDKIGSVIYQRVFSPAVTKELRLYGLEGEDQFVVTGKQAIRVRLIGGPGADTFNVAAEGKRVLVYDASFEENNVYGVGMHKKLDDDPLVNEFQRQGFAYATAIPGMGIELTREGGLFLGPTLRITTPGFRKQPFATSHFFYLTRALQSPSWHARYDAVFTHLAKKTDLLLHSEAFLPTVRTYFFGYGNNTVYNIEKGWEYYVARYRLVDAALLLRHTPVSWLKISAGPVLQYLQLESGRNVDNHISTLISRREQNPSIYGGYWYSGADVQVTADRRNNPVFTTNGLFVNLSARSMKGLSDGSGNFKQLSGQISLFTDVLLRQKLVVATNFGGGYNRGRFQFPQAQYLGFRQNLRGYNFQRFAGRARAYNNTELRLNTGVHNFILFKGPAGLIGFHDIGRVWAAGETSDTWHRGWGGGIWVSPFQQLAVVATLASSKEEKAWLQLSLGFQF